MPSSTGATRAWAALVAGRVPATAIDRLPYATSRGPASRSRWARPSAPVTPTTASWVSGDRAGGGGAGVAIAPTPAAVKTTGVTTPTASGTVAGDDHGASARAAAGVRSAAARMATATGHVSFMLLERD